MPTSDETTTAPSVVAKAWAELDRDPRAGLTLSRVVEAGMVVADEAGLAAVSMGRVAQELGFTTMALYRHVGNKTELLHLMQDAAPGPAPRHLALGAEWRDGLQVWSQQLWAALVRRPWTLQIPVAGPPVLPVSLDWMDWALGFLAPLPLANWEKLYSLMLLNAHVRFEAGIAAGATELEGEEEGAAYEAALRSVTSAERHPALHRILSGSLFDLPPEIPPDQIDDRLRDFGLQRILDGVEHLVRTREQQ